MRTTTRSSELAAALAAAALLAGCVTPTDPGELFQLTPESAAHKAAQTRTFETSDEIELLSASAAALQDLGFQVTESEREVGFLRATKERSAREYGQEIQRFLIFLLSLGGTVAPVDLHQQINAALATRPLDAKRTRHELRIVFYRIIWKGDGQSGSGQYRSYIPPGQQKMQMIRDPEIYQQFFARLQKSVFLETEKI